MPHHLNSYSFFRSHGRVLLLFICPTPSAFQLCSTGTMIPHTTNQVSMEQMKGRSYDGSSARAFAPLQHRISSPCIRAGACETGYWTSFFSTDQL